MRNTTVLVFSVFAFVLALPSFATTYEIDPAHSSVDFKIRHLIGKVSGKFDKFSGTFDYEPKKSESWKANAKIEAASINTGNKKRDEHLQSPDFFDVKKYPTITFESTKISDASSDSATMEGKLTLHGVTKPVKLALEMGGVGPDQNGNQRAGFTGKTKVNRQDFGIVWNKALETGGVVLGDEVEIVLEIEGVAKKDAPVQKAKK